MPSYRNNGLALFFVFAVANAVLAYSPVSFEAKLWVSLLGLIIPFALAFFTISKEAGRNTPIYSRETFRINPASFWTLALLAVLVRFGQNHIPGYWPTPDDGLDAFVPLELSHRWNWNFFYGPAQMPPVFYWLLGLFFKVFTPSLLSLSLFPALGSILVFIVAFAAARNLFSKSFGCLCGFLTAFSFWPLYTGKFCAYMTIYLSWEVLTFALLVSVVRKGFSKAGWRNLILLSVFTGIGFWTGIAWPVMAVVVFIPVYEMAKENWKKNKLFFLVLSILPLISALFFAYHFFSGEKGSHLHSLFAFGKGMDWRKQVFDSFSNFTAFFWGCDLQNSYGPVWGGVLNPLLGSFFFIGVLECRHLRRVRFVQWLALSFILLIVPGVVSKNFDLFRNVQVLPLLLLVAALGIQAVLFKAKSQRVKLFILVIILLSAGLDLRHLWLIYHPHGAAMSGNSHSVEFSKAYEILSGKNEKATPGLILFDLHPNIADQTLNIATYAFNAARNPKLSLREAKWVAVIVNCSYRHFLSQRFPKGEWFQLFDEHESDIRVEDEWMLGIVPIESGDGEWVNRWMGADQSFREVIWLAMNIPWDRGRKEVFEKLSEVYPRAQSDPFLESLYWEMVFDFHRWENLYGDKNTAVHYSAGFSAIHNALARGYPTAYFYNELGGFLMIEKDYAGARKAFLKAVQSEVNYTSAEENLNALDTITGHISPR